MKGVLYFSLSLALLLAVSATALDVNPPNWRGEPGTSWVRYEFIEDLTQGGTVSGPFSPVYDDSYLPYGEPSIDVTPGTGAGWFAETEGWNPEGVEGDGWWNLSGEIQLFMYNDPRTNPHKEIWIQLTWSPQSPSNRPYISVQDDRGVWTPETSNALVEETLYSDPINNDVIYSVFHVDLPYNPQFETIKIRGGINVDELVVDTFCTPEPASITLLGLAGALVLRKRK